MPGGKVRLQISPYDARGRSISRLISSGPRGPYRSIPQSCLRSAGGKQHIVTGLLALCCLSTCMRAQQSSPPLGVEAAPSARSLEDGHAGTGSVTGTVLDKDGKYIPGTVITLTGAPGGIAVRTLPDSGEGQFHFDGLPAGTFEVTFSAPGFSPVAKSIVLHAGESRQVQDTFLAPGLNLIEVRVSQTAQEIAEEQIQVEEKQRVLGVIPNFYVSYDHSALPLTSRQKFELVWKTSFDPVNILATGIAAGIEQASNSFSGFGQGSAGYAKRYAASYGDGLIGDMLGNAILPSLLKQDPRYFYKGTGTIRSRVFYALANAVVCKGDNGRWQVNYSGIGGSLAAGGISNLYYPAANRDGIDLTFENALIGIGSTGIANLFQEFLVRKLTPHTHGAEPVQP